MGEHISGVMDRLLLVAAGAYVAAGAMGLSPLEPEKVAIALGWRAIKWARAIAADWRSAESRQAWRA